MAIVPSQRLIVVGASAGGMAALKKLVAGLPCDLAAPVCVVMHMSADMTGDVLVRALAAAGPLPCQHALDGQRLLAGTVHIAPPDHHMLIEGGLIQLTKGARENRYRPAIDTLFRSAAVACGSRVIGVILTGLLDDGTSGMMAIKRCGGLCIAQDPADADYPDMPQSVISNVGVDHVAAAADLGALLSQLLRDAPGPDLPPPRDVIIEARIAQRVQSDLAAVDALGEQAPFNCPDCGGVLWRMHHGDLLRYRCHTGHAFSAAKLLAVQTAGIEETLWTALRMFEERQNLMVSMAVDPEARASRALAERRKDAQVHIGRIRAMLRAHDAAGRSQPDPALPAHD